jgi:hypothetical protein
LRRRLRGRRYRQISIGVPQRGLGRLLLALRCLLLLELRKLDLGRLILVRLLLRGLLILKKIRQSAESGHSRLYMVKP